MPKKCPVCGTAIVKEGANSYCPAGITCPGQLVCCLTHWASREALDTVSRNTDYLVVGVNPGSKLTDAERNGIEIINESQFEKFLGG
jgi:NAD-dependent DNA ligase